MYDVPGPIFIGPAAEAKHQQNRAPDLVQRTSVGEKISSVTKNLKTVYKMWRAQRMSLELISYRAVIRNPENIGYGPIAVFDVGRASRFFGCDSGDEEIET